MKKINYLKNILLFFTFLIFFLLPAYGLAWIRGIYVTQSTLESTRTIKYLIGAARAAGIDTFVIDYWGKNKYTSRNIQLVKAAGLHFVARIVMFPNGALPSQIHSQSFLQKRYKLIWEAVALGADKIQLDYIRFRPTQRQSSENTKTIFNLIKTVRDMLKTKGIPLEIDIFGEAASMESKAIGQDGYAFGSVVNAICPMVYPSHYYPYSYHAVRPYQTIYKSLTDLRSRLKQYPDVKVVAYIELFNLRFPLSREAKIKYILEEMRAVKDSGANGWYAWSATNKYRLLFHILEARGGG